MSGIVLVAPLVICVPANIIARKLATVPASVLSREIWNPFRMAAEAPASTDMFISPKPETTIRLVAPE